jgi:hypothetical protein
LPISRMNKPVYAVPGVPRAPTSPALGVHRGTF